MKKIKLLILGVALILLFITVGCMDQDEEGMNERNTRDNQIDNTRNNRDNHTDYNRNTNNRYNNMTEGDRTTRNNRNNNLDNRRIEDRTDRMSNRDNDNQYDVADEAADKITSKMKDIDYAYVLTTKNNAYVAVVKDDDNRSNSDNRNMNRNRTNDNNKNNKSTRRNDRNINTRNINNDNTHEETLTEDVKREITDIVKSVDNNIDNVYVSTNPDFADLTNDYIDQMNDGRPIRGFFDEIGNMIERVFPQNKR